MSVAPAVEVPVVPAPLAPARVSVNVMSIIGLALVFLVPVGGIVFGHIALSQIRRTREPGRGFAVAALAVGYGTIALEVIFISM